MATRFHIHRELLPEDVCAYPLQTSWHTLTAELNFQIYFFLNFMSKSWIVYFTWKFGYLNIRPSSFVVVYINQLLGASCTWKLVRTLFLAIFNLFQCYFCLFLDVFCWFQVWNHWKRFKNELKRLKIHNTLWNWGKFLVGGEIL